MVMDETEIKTRDVFSVPKSSRQEKGLFTLLSFFPRFLSNILQIKK